MTHITIEYNLEEVIGKDSTLDDIKLVEEIVVHIKEKHKITPSRLEIQR